MSGSPVVARRPDWSKMIPWERSWEGFPLVFLPSENGRLEKRRLRSCYGEGVYAGRTYFCRLGERERERRRERERDSYWIDSLSSALLTLTMDSNMRDQWSHKMQNFSVYNWSTRTAKNKKCLDSEHKTIYIPGCDYKPMACNKTKIHCFSPTKQEWYGHLK